MWKIYRNNIEQGFGEYQTKEDAMDFLMEYHADLFSIGEAPQEFDAWNDFDVREID